MVRKIKFQFEKNIFLFFKNIIELKTFENNICLSITSLGTFLSRYNVCIFTRHTYTHTRALITSQLAKVG